ncbi:sugar phosphate isomerase/epimerase family protein [Botrimarina sp.]|uniref:sugar phosphate isomerase/epimerase family protein n=1 Tax=Botrimarina sp. TaxID=2795802 RepID=UPI0032EF6744
MLLGYNTNGFAHHDPEDAMRVLAEIGYRAVAVTIDHGVINPRDPRLGDQAGRLRRLAKKLGLTLVVETGARFLLDPWTKHEPTLVSPDPERRAQRVAYLQQAVDTAREVGAVCTSAWSGVVHDGAHAEEAWNRLVPALAEVLAYADRGGMPVAFEPEPGMLVDTLSAYRELKERLLAAGATVEALRLTVDVGHLHCLDETPIADQIERHASEIANVHLEDMIRGVHRHLPLGEGEIDFPPVLAALEKHCPGVPVCVELSRQSHEAPQAARTAYDFLAPLVRA